MGYIIHSTQNPLGRKPWNALLQPGGLGKYMGAFFPNAEAIGQPSLIIDRDAANPGGWKGKAFAGAPIPRNYYPPDARLQYTANRGQSMGRLGVAPVFALHAANGGFNSGALPAGIYRANTTPQNSSTSNVGTSPVAPVWAGNRAWNMQPTVIPVTTASGATVMQSTQPAATVAASGLATAAQVSGTPVPVGTSLGALYTDASGNVWGWNGTSWVVTSAAAASTASVGDWLSESTIISSLPNYAVAGGGLLLAWLLFKKK